MVTTPNLWIGDDNSVDVREVRTVKDETYVPNATVTVTIKTATGTLLDTITADWIVGTRGRYYGIIPASTTAILVENEQYEIVIRVQLDRSRWESKYWRVARYRGQY